MSSKFEDRVLEGLQWVVAVAVFAVFVAMVSGVLGVMFLIAKYAFLLTSGGL